MVNFSERASPQTLSEGDTIGGGLSRYLWLGGGWVEVETSVDFFAVRYLGGSRRGAHMGMVQRMQVEEWDFKE